MADLNGMLGKLLSGGVATGVASGMAGGVASSLLMSKSGRKLGKKALKFGGVAAVGALAYSAYKRYSNAQNSNPSIENNGGVQLQTMEVSTSPQLMNFENPELQTQEFEHILVRAMIAASRADGMMDVQESQAIYQHIQSLKLDPEQESLLVDELSRAVDVDSIILAATTPEKAAEIYTVSLLAVDEQNAAEKAYLSMLAARLKLPRELLTAIEKEVEDQKVVN